MKCVVLYLWILILTCIGYQSFAQCSAPTAATVTTATSSCINNGSVLVTGVNGGGGTGAVKEYAITASSNANQPLIGYQNDSNFHNLYPGTYTVSIRYNCNGTLSNVLTRTATITGNYQTMNAGFTGITNSFCNNGAFTVNVTNGYTGISGHYTYQLVSAQNAPQPDPSAPTPVQTGNTFNSLAAGTYYVRIFDDCGNFITRNVTISQGTAVDPFFASPNCGTLLFQHQKYGCNDSAHYRITPSGFIKNTVTFNNTNLSIPGRAILFYPDGTSDTAVVNTYTNPFNVFGTILIDSFINAGQLGNFSMKWIDACGNTYSSFNARFDTSKVTTLSPTNIAVRKCGTTGIIFNGSITSCNSACPTLISGNTYLYKPQVFYTQAPLLASLDSGATWHSTLTDTIYVPCSSISKTYRPRFVLCGDTLYSCTSISIIACKFSFPAREVNSWACNGKSGMTLINSGNTYSDAAAVKVEFLSMPAGQAAVPPMGIWPVRVGDKFFPYNNNGDFKNYMNNLVPGKYVYQVTDTTCGTTYIDSITLTNLHAYDVTSISVQQTCTNASVTVTLSNNSFYASGTSAAGQPTANTYRLALINSANTVVQTQLVTVPAFVLGAATNGSVQTGSVTFTNIPVGTYTVKTYHDSTIWDYLYLPCGPLTDTVNVTLSALSISPTLFVACGGNSASIAVAAGGGIAPYSYELYNGTVTPANLVTTQSTPLFSGLNAGQTYSVRVIDNCGTGVSVSKSFAPYNVQITTSGNSCPGGNYSFSVDTVAGATYAWAKDGMSLSNTTNAYNISGVDTLDYGNYTVTVSVPGCADFTASRQLTLGVCFPLPLELLSFYGKADACNAILVWKTANEHNFDHFDVQYSANGSSWKTIGIVAGKTTGGPANDYTYKTVQAEIAGAYRLALTDKDGTYRLSNVVNVRTDCNTTNNNWTIFPNPLPAGTNLHLALNAAEGQKAIRMVITDLPGQKLVEKVLDVQPGHNVCTIPVQGLKGVYFISLYDQNGLPVGKAQQLIFL